MRRWGDLSAAIVRANRTHPEWCYDEIAAFVGCRPSYVRAVCYRRKLTATSRFKRRWDGVTGLPPRGD